MDINEKLQRVRSVLNKHVLEREAETDGILMGLLAGVNTLFLGEPGTAKTMHIQLLSRLVGLKDFDVLMSETIKPEQIFGPVDIPALAEGKMCTKYQEYAPGSDILFFDEIFKANATVLNPLLWLINEGRYRDGDNGIVKCPVKATFAASNELPDDEMLKALYDRFILRYEVHYLKDDKSLMKLMDSYLYNPIDNIDSILNKKEVEQLISQTKEVKINVELQELALRIRRQIEIGLRFNISDRRFLKALRVVQAQAILEGRNEAIKSDLEILADIFWESPDQKSKIQAIVYSLASMDASELSTYREQAEVIRLSIDKGGDMKKRVKELHEIYQSVRSLKGRPAKKIAAEIRSIGVAFLRRIEDRKTFNLYRVKIGGNEIFKVSQSTEMVFTTSELRKLGLRHRIRAKYWWTNNIQQFENRALKNGLKVVISRMEQK